MRKLTNILAERERAAADDRDTRSRTDARRAQRTLEDTLARLAKDLVELRERQLEQLELSEELLDAVRDAQAINSPPARNRQLRVIRGVLRDSDWSVIRGRLEAILKHGTLPDLGNDATDELSNRAGEWAVRLLGEGAESLQKLLDECPTADRNHLRTLIRNVEKADAAERRKKAEQKLTATLRGLLRNRE